MQAKSFVVVTTVLVSVGIALSLFASWAVRAQSLPVRTPFSANSSIQHKSPGGVIASTDTNVYAVRSDGSTVLWTKRQ